VNTLFTGPDNSLKSLTNATNNASSNDAMNFTGKTINIASIVQHVKDEVANIANISTTNIEGEADLHKITVDADSPPIQTADGATNELNHDVSQMNTHSVPNLKENHPKVLQDQPGPVTALQGGEVHPHKEPEIISHDEHNDGIASLVSDLVEVLLTTEGDHAQNHHDHAEEDNNSDENSEQLNSAADLDEMLHGGVDHSHDEVHAEATVENGTTTNENPSNGTQSEVKQPRLGNVHGPRKSFATDLDDILHGGHPHSHKEDESADNQSDISNEVRGPATGVNKLEAMLHGGGDAHSHTEEGANFMVELGKGKVIGVYDPDRILHGDDIRGGSHHSHSHGGGEDQHVHGDGQVRTELKPLVMTNQQKDGKGDVITSSDDNVGKPRVENVENYRNRKKTTKENDVSSQGWSFISDTLWQDILAAKRRYISKLWGDSPESATERPFTVHDEA